MAKGNPMQYIRKPEPAVLEIEFALAAGTSYLDINQVLSVMNRKFLRQGMQIPVASMEVQFQPIPGQPLPTGSVTIEKLPTTWVLANAWVESFKTWQTMNNKALEGTESISPRFMDFKIYADSAHHALGFDANITPNMINFRQGEWESSKVYIPIASSLAPVAGDDTMHDLELIATGANYPGVSAATGLDAVSLIEGYAAGRALPPSGTDPNVPADASDVAGLDPENWMSAISNEGVTQSHEILEDLISENNSAPYPFEGGPIQGAGPGVFYPDTVYPGGGIQYDGDGMQFHDKLLITSSTIGGSDTAIGGVFPCGLVKFNTVLADAAASITLILRLLPGDHRGYLQEPMQEMNRQ